MAKRVWHVLTPEDRRQIRRLRAKGLSHRQIALTCGWSATAVATVLRPFGGVVRAEDLNREVSGRLSLSHRFEIYEGIRCGETFTVIAGRLGFAVSTISREVGGVAGRETYHPVTAHRLACGRARRPKPSKMTACPALLARVETDLRALWSPQQIAARLRVEFPGEETMWVSHETIYKSIYVQGRGELRRELAACLRSGRTQRVPHHRLERRGRIPEMVMISDRPAEGDDRAVPGFWEGDLIIGKNNKSAIGTLVERHTRYVILLHLPNGHGALEVRNAMAEAMRRFPAHLRRNVTWDQGPEMSEHREFTSETGIDVYFCPPHSPWMRGSNENTNGLLRQYFPKGTDLSVHTAATLQAVADSLNGRPRKTLNWRTPTEALTAVLASTA